MVASAPGIMTPQELDLRHEFAHLFSGKSTKNAVNRAALFDSSSPVCTKSYSAPPDPLFLRGRQGKGKDGRSVDVKKRSKIFNKR